MLLIRPAGIDDCGLLRTMIRELAEFEHALEFVSIREEDLARDGFVENPRFRALLAEWHGQPAAYAFFFGYYSTWADSRDAQGAALVEINKMPELERASRPLPHWCC